MWGQSCVDCAMPGTGQELALSRTTDELGARWGRGT